MRLLPVTILMALALAGCTGKGPLLSSPPPNLDGWVLDDGLRPVMGATVSVTGTDLHDKTNGQGHYTLHAPKETALIVTASAEGFASKSGYVGVGYGDHMTMNFSLVKLPAKEAYTQVEDFKGQLTCAITAVVGQDDPQKPHEHKGVKCADVIPGTVDSSNRWHYVLPAGTEGVVLEVFWDSSNELSTSLVLRVQVEATNETIGFAEGPSPLHIQMSHFKVLQLLDQGNDAILLSILPGAGTGTHEHGAAGAFIEQPFHMFATAFFNQAVDPTYSIAKQ